MSLLSQSGQLLFVVVVVVVVVVAAVVVIVIVLGARFCNTVATLIWFTRLVFQGIVSTANLSVF